MRPSVQSIGDLVGWLEVCRRTRHKWLSENHPKRRVLTGFGAAYFQSDASLPGTCAAHASPRAEFFCLLAGLSFSYWFLFGVEACGWDEFGSLVGGVESDLPGGVVDHGVVGST